MNLKGGVQCRHPEFALDEPFVEMYADPSKLNAALEGAKRRVLAFGAFVAKAGAGAAAAGAAIFAPLTRMFTAAVEEGAEVGKLASQLGSTAEEVSRLRGAFAQAGVGADDFAGSMEKLQDKISHAADANGFLLDNLQSLGMAKDFMGKGLDEQLDMIAERIRAIPNAMDQARAGKDLGFSAEMVEVLKKGKAGLDEYRAAAERNGDVMSGEQTKQAMEVQKEYNRVMLAGKSTLLEVGKALLPTGASFTSVGKDVQNALTHVREWIQQNKAIIVAATAVAGGLLVGGLAIGAFGAAAAVAIPIVTALKVSVSVLYAILAPLTGTVGACAVGFAVLGAAAAVAGAYLASDGKLLEELGEVAERVAAGIAESWKGISNAFKAGDFSLAFSIGLKTAEVAWRNFMLYLTASWVAFKDVFVNVWSDATTWLAKAIVSLAEGVTRAIAEPIRKLVDGYNKVAGFFTDRAKIDTSFLPSDEEIKKKGQQIRDEIEKGAKAEQTERDTFRKNQIEKELAALEIVKRELAALNKQAEDAANAAGQAKPEEEPKAPAPPPKPKLPSMSALSEAAKGTLGGSSIQQTLGYGDNIGRRQLDETQKLREAVQEGNRLLNVIAEKPRLVYT